MPALPLGAGDATADDVLPVGLSPLGARHHVVQVEFAAGERLPAILAGVAVPDEDVAPAETGVAPGDPGHTGEDHPPGGDEDAGFQHRAAPGAPSRKYLGIRAPLHPLQLRCSSSPYSPGTPSLVRLAGAAHRRSRCFKLFARRYTGFMVAPTLPIVRWSVNGGHDRGKLRNLVVPDGPQIEEHLPSPYPGDHARRPPAPPLFEDPFRNPRGRHGDDG